MRFHIPHPGGSSSQLERDPRERALMGRRRPTIDPSTDPAVKPRTAFLFGLLRSCDAQTPKRCVTPLNPSGNHCLRADRVRKRRHGFDRSWPWVGLFLAEKRVRVLEPACPRRFFIFRLSQLNSACSVAQTLTAQIESRIESNPVATARQQLHNFIFRRRRTRTGLQATPNLCQPKRARRNQPPAV